MDNQQWIEFCTNAASGNLADARRYLEDKSALNRVCDSVRAGLMWGIEAWLRSHNYEPDVGNGWHSMRSQFIGVAPEDLRSEVSHCLGSVVLHEGPEARIENDELVYYDPDYFSEEWQRTAMKHLVRAEEALELLLKDIS